MMRFAERACTKTVHSRFMPLAPSGHTDRTGAVFLHCDITSMNRGTQYFVKGRGAVTAIDTRINGENVKACNWRDFPQREERYYHYGTTLNGHPYRIGQNSPETSIDLTGKPAPRCLPHRIGKRYDIQSL